MDSGNNQIYPDVIIETAIQYYSTAVIAFSDHNYVHRAFYESISIDKSYLDL